MSVNERSTNYIRRLKRFLKTRSQEREVISTTAVSIVRMIASITYFVNSTVLRDYRVSVFSETVCMN